MDEIKKILAPLIAETRSRAEIVEPGDSFWYHRPQRHFPPRTIARVEEHDGSDRLSLACIQPGLTAREQKQWARAWCEQLPAMRGIRFLWFPCRVTQELFDAACQMPDLEGLYIKWSGIKSIDQLSKLTTLKYLHIGSSPSLQPLSVLGTLPRLVWLELENIRAAADLSFLEALPQLVGLSVTGDSNSLKTLALQTLRPVAFLEKLEWLQLQTVTVEDGSLASIGGLPSLKFLRLSNRFAMEELARLAGRLPQVSCDLFKPFVGPFEWNPCKKCKQKTMVSLTGKGKPWLCTHCDAARVRKHEQAFYRIVAEAQAS